MKFLIPTFGREIQLTFEYLRGFGGIDVTFQTQDRRDRDLISARYPDARVSLDESATCLSQNANNGLRAFRDGEIVAVMDDDIRYAIVCEGRRRHKASAAQFVERVERLARRMNERRADVAIGYSSNGISFRDAGSRIEENKIGSGWLTLVRVGSVWYDGGLTSCEDYDMQLRVISNGGTVLRDSGIAPQGKSRTKANGPQVGGRGFYYEDEEHRRNVAEVVRRYYPIARSARRGSAITLNEKYF